MAKQAACSNSDHTVFFGSQQAVATRASVSGITSYLKRDEINS